MLADFYHMDEENEPLDELVVNAGWLAHVHLADTGRMSPGTGSPVLLLFCEATGSPLPGHDLGRMRRERTGDRHARESGLPAWLLVLRTRP